MTSSLNIYKQFINNYFISNFIHQYPDIIKEQIHYLWNDGKRLRPILFLAFSKPTIIEQDFSDISSNIVNSECIDFAISIEFLHCLSLVIDDLPSMDNEIQRRDKVCFHIKYGLVKTNFFIYYMLNKTINYIANDISNMIELNIEQTEISKDSRLKIIEDIHYITRYLLGNLIDGQYFDMEFTSSNFNNSNLILDRLTNQDKNILIITDLIISILDELDISLDESLEKETEKYIILSIKKTGTLFVLPIINGFLIQLLTKKAVYTGNESIDNTIANINITNAMNTLDIHTEFNLGDDNFVNLIIIWGYFLGFLFQSSDDFLDKEEDLIHNKPNICNIIGIHNSVLLISNSVKIATSILEYIITNSKLIWPTIDIQIDTICIQEIINLINARINGN